VVEHIEGSIAVTNVKLERFAPLVVVNLDRDTAVIGVPEQANLNAVDDAAIEFSRHGSNAVRSTPGLPGWDGGECGESIVGSLDA
jgi:hypothetical protein